MASKSSRIYSLFTGKREPFLPLRPTLQAAQLAGMPLGDFIDYTYGHWDGKSMSPTRLTLMHMIRAGVFGGKIERVCEIGPGSGRYLEPTIACANRTNETKQYRELLGYEIYELSEDWRNWLVSEYRVQAQECDGHSLSWTKTATVDLVHAHKVFPSTPLFVTLSYIEEMGRVVKPGGWVVFDAMTEACLIPEHVDAWLDAHVLDWDWEPHCTARRCVVDMLADMNVRFVTSFLVELYPGVTECLIFRKDS